MKHKIFLLSLLFLSFIACSQEIKLIRIMVDGSSVADKYLADTETLVVYDSEKNGYRTENIKGLEKFRNLKIVEFQNLAFLKNYDFLRELKNCKKLYICTGHYFDFHILQNLTDLEYLEFSGFISDEEIDKIRKEGLDVSFLPNLKMLFFHPMNAKINFDINIKYANGREGS